MANAACDVVVASAPEEEAMGRLGRRACCFVIVGLCHASGCGQEDPPGCNEGPVGDSYFPLVAGTKWTFEETEEPSGEVTEKKWVIKEEKPGDIFVFEHTGMKPRTVEVELDDEGRVFWKRKLSRDRDTGEPILDCYFDPLRLRFDPTLSDGAPSEVSTQHEITIEDCDAWDENADMETNLESCPSESLGLTDTWSVTEIGREVETDAGTFTDTLCHSRVEQEEGAEGTSTKEYCWAQGIGKIWEDDLSNKTEELVSVCFPE
jgi:hypothetical protein